MANFIKILDNVIININNINLIHKVNNNYAIKCPEITLECKSEKEQSDTFQQIWETICHKNANEFMNFNNNTIIAKK